MTTTQPDVQPGAGGNEPTVANGGRSGWGLLHRQLDHYPSSQSRYGYLAIVVLTTIVLYYVYYVPSSVTPLMLPYYDMSFLYFLVLIVISNAVGAFTAFIGGLSDRIGRANLTIVGLLVVGLLQFVAIPNATSKAAFSVAYVAIGFFEGIILVVTPALIRDFSPQVGRASAMGFWALGPTVGSLVTSLVATHTLSHLGPWQDQFIISGLVCLGMFVIALLFLRELSPKIRDQLMVSTRERALVEARARGLDVERATRHPLRSMLRLDLISSSLGISLFLLIYFASVSVLTIYWATVFNKTTSDANGINTWYWAFDSVMLIVIGVVSDKLRVRKPLMLIGAVGSIVTLFFFIQQANHPNTAYSSLVVVVSFLGVFIACAYSPWMAGYTENVEAVNPALSATGLAVWGWVLRIVVAISFLVLPHVVTTATTLVDHQNAATGLQAFQAAQPYVPSLTGGPPPPKAPQSVIDQLNAVPLPATAPAQTLAVILERYPSTHNLVATIGSLTPRQQRQAAGLVKFQPLALKIQNGHPVSNAAIRDVGSSSPQLAILLQQEKTVAPAQKASPHEWQTWWWVCMGGQVIFLLLVFTMRGPWSPRRARLQAQEHEEKVERELAALHS